VKPGDLVQLEYVTPKRGYTPCEWLKSPGPWGLLVSMSHEGCCVILDNVNYQPATYFVSEATYDSGPVWQISVLQEGE
jgi:hypothetical protein